MRPENFNIDDVIESLRGTPNSIDDVLPEGMVYENLTQVDHDAIDAEIFECSGCTWWYDVSDSQENELNEPVCHECANSY